MPEIPKAKTSEKLKSILQESYDKANQDLNCSRVFSESTRYGKQRQLVRTAESYNPNMNFGKSSAVSSKRNARLKKMEALPESLGVNFRKL